MIESEYSLAKLKWVVAQDNGCNCPSGHPPCSFCVDGFSLELDEYIELYFDQQVPQITSTAWE